jgi:hypothetical protein
LPLRRKKYIRDDYTRFFYEQGKKGLLEYTVGDMILKIINSTDSKYASMKVSFTLTRYV